jgi:hypothetical protein
MKGFDTIEQAAAWCAACSAPGVVVFVRDEDGEEAMVWDGGQLRRYTMTAYAAAMAGLRISEVR